MPDNKKPMNIKKIPIVIIILMLNLSQSLPEANVSSNEKMEATDSMNPILLNPVFKSLDIIGINGDITDEEMPYNTNEK